VNTPIHNKILRQEGTSMHKKILALVLAGVSLGLLQTGLSFGANYPAKPIEILVTYGPGGTSDLIARQIAEIARKYLGQPLFVSNRPGAGGTTAVSEIVNAKPDGYKVLYLPTNYLATTIKTQKIPFDPNTIAPLINFVEVKQGLVVKADSPWKTLRQFLDYAKQNPGKMRWNNTGRGVGSYLSASLIFKRAGIEAIDIPYKSAPEQVSAVLGGHSDAGGIPYATGKTYVQAGTLRYLVFYSNQRFAEPSDVPSAAELGFPEYFTTYSGIWVHRNMPEDVKKTLYDALKKTYDDPEFKKGVDTIGDEPRFGGPDFIRESIKKGQEAGIPILKELGLYVE
jgi:tripartite-type tricarboxylate transporter receptor subunit TctC